MCTSRDVVIPSIHEDYVALPSSASKQAQESPAGVLAQVMGWNVDDLAWRTQRDQVLVHSVFHSSTPKLSYPSLICVVHALFYLSSTNQSSLWEQFFTEAVHIWSSRAFLRQCTSEQHEFISRSILYCIQLLDKPPSSADVLAEFLRGVQHHLQQTSSRFRRWGMVRNHNRKLMTSK